MRNEEKYKQAFWAWFVENAHEPGRWGHHSLNGEAREHLTACGVNVDYSPLPEVGSITEWGSTDYPDVTVPALQVHTWACNCGTYSDRSQTMFIAGRLSMSDIILGVLQKAEGA